MNALHEQHKAGGLAVLLINMGEDAELVRRTVKTRGYTAPVLLDPGQRVTTAYGVTATPTVYVVDRGLQIVARAVGRRDWAGDAGRRLVAALLAP
jgi:hypothetical protein